LKYKRFKKDFLEFIYFLYFVKRKLSGQFVELVFGGLMSVKG
jgi:hypothetical protein